MDRSYLLSVLNKKISINLDLFRNYFKETNREGVEEFIKLILSNGELASLAANTILNYYKNKYQIIKLEGNNISFYY